LLAAFRLTPADLAETITETVQAVATPVFPDSLTSRAMRR
jgi:hypothetical protein